MRPVNAGTIRLRGSVERATRRVVDLRQGAITARAIDLERKSQTRINRAINGNSAMQEAEALIRRVADQDDPLAHSEIVDESTTRSRTRVPRIGSLPPASDPPPRCAPRTSTSWRASAAA